MIIRISPQAERKLKKFPKFDQIAIGQKIRSFTTEKRPVGEEKLVSKFKDVCRVRVGDYRIVYKRFSESVYIITIGHRKEVYDLLSRLIQ